MKNDAEVDLPGVSGSERVQKNGMTGAHVLKSPEVRKSESPKVRKSESPKIRNSESPIFIPPLLMSFLDRGLKKTVLSRRWARDSRSCLSWNSFGAGMSRKT